MFEGVLALALLQPSAPPVEERQAVRYYSGVYVSLFETSLFEPCESDQRWWLEAPGAVNRPFWQWMEELRIEHENQSGEALGSASPVYFLTAKGRVSEIGEYGLLGQYHRRFDLIEVIEFRLASPQEHEQCLTSGYLK